MDMYYGNMIAFFKVLARKI